jgi:hypothetical protein
MQWQPLVMKPGLAPMILKTGISIMTSLIVSPHSTTPEPSVTIWSQMTQFGPHFGVLTKRIEKKYINFSLVHLFKNKWKMNRSYCTSKFPLDEFCKRALYIFIYLHSGGFHLYRMSHRYWADFWVRVPKYGSRFPSTGPILGIYLGPGSRVQVQVPEYRSRFPSTGPGSRVRKRVGPISMTHTVPFPFWFSFQLRCKLVCSGISSQSVQNI